MDKQVLAQVLEFVALCYKRCMQLDALPVEAIKAAASECRYGL